MITEHILSRGLYYMRGTSGNLEKLQVLRSTAAEGKLDQNPSQGMDVRHLYSLNT